MKHTKKAAAKRRFAATAAPSTSVQSIFLSTGLAILLAAGIGILLLLLCTALLLSVKNPGKYDAAAALFVLYLTAALTGALAALLHRRRAALICGLLAGAGLLLLLLPFVFILPRLADGSTALRIGLYAAIPFATVAGALLAARTPARRNRPRHRF